MKKKKKLNIPRVLLAITILILLIVLVIKIITGFTGKVKEPENITLLLNNNLVKLKNEMLNENGVIYVSKEDISDLFDNNMYYNEAEKELITTYNKHIAVLKIDENFMIVNDSNVELKAPMIEENNKVYMPFSEMGIVYDLEFEYSESNKRLIGDSTANEKKTSLALKKFNLKNKPSMFSSNIEKVAHGEYVTIVEDASKRYFKIRTDRGNIGYIRKRKVSKPETIRENWEEEKIKFEILKDASTISKDYKTTKINKENNNVVIPAFFYLDKEGEFLDKTSSETDEYKVYENWAKENNIEIWVTLKNNSYISDSLLNYTERNKVINTLYKKLVEYQFSGINIDFEKIDDVNSFNRFVIELTPRLKELGIKVAVTNNKNVDKDKLSKVVDIVIE